MAASLEMKPSKEGTIEDVAPDRVEVVGENVDADDEYSYEEQRKIVHKIDRRLVTGLGMLFAISLMDRSNLGSGAIAGMTKDLDLNVGTRFSIVLLVFFGPYIVLQMPSAVLVRSVGPKLFLSTITFCWGLVMMCYGFIHDWKSLIALRMIVGAFEAGLFPGAIYLLSLWYSRYDVHTRYSAFYTISCIGPACSGILAYGFMQMNGLGGYAGWRWIFIMEGLVTMVVAVVGYFLLVDFPQQAHDKNHFLSEREAAFILRRINRDREDAGELEKFNVRKFFGGAKDIKVWAYGFVFFCTTVVAYAIQFFLPIILRAQLGFSVGLSQLLCAPPYVLGALLMWLQAYLGDKYHLRSPFILFNSVLSIVGLSLLGRTKTAGVKYFGIFLVTAGCNATVPAVLAWQANNIRGQWKRGFCAAMLLTFGGTGGIAGALVFRARDAPAYTPGVITTLTCACVTILMTIIMVAFFHHSNQQVKAGKKVLENLPGFYYTL